MENINKFCTFGSRNKTSGIIFKTPDDAVVIKKKKKRKNKHKNKNQQHGVRKPFFKAKQKCNMSSIEETYTKAATWQFKHQIAYWKAKAMALEFENRVLHDIIRKNHTRPSIPSSTVSDVTSDSSTNSESEVEHQIADLNGHYETQYIQDVQDSDLEASEELIQFLTANAEYKEDARKERERLNAKQNMESEDDRVKRMEAPPSMDVEEQTPDLEELYGNNWQRISALEMSLQCQFMSDCDKYKPRFWPNIPFNFN